MLLAAQRWLLMEPYTRQIVRVWAVLLVWSREQGRRKQSAEHGVCEKYEEHHRPLEPRVRHETTSDEVAIRAPSSCTRQLVREAIPEAAAIACTHARHPRAHSDRRGPSWDLRRNAAAVWASWRARVVFPSRRARMMGREISVAATCVVVGASGLPLACLGARAGLAPKVGGGGGEGVR